MSTFDCSRIDTNSKLSVTTDGTKKLNNNFANYKFNDCSYIMKLHKDKIFLNL